MSCPVCYRTFEEGERLVANVMETFIFKPANVKDTVNAAKVSPDELRASRQDYKQTIMATTFYVYGKVPTPEGAFNIKHALCVVQRTGQFGNRNHALLKHSIRYNRSAVRK